MSVENLINHTYQHPIRTLGLVVGLIMAIILGVWSINHSFVEIHLEGYSEASSSVEVVAIDQSNGEVAHTLTDVDDSTVKVTLKRGEYELYAASATSKTVTVVNVGGFLSSQSVSLKYNPQHHQAFVGNNINTCAQMAGGELYSWLCGGSVNDTKLHTGATNTNPTTAQNLRGSSAWRMTSLLEISNNPFVVMQSTFHDHGNDDGGFHGEEEVAYGRYPLNGLLVDVGTSTTYEELDGDQKFIFESNPTNNSLLVYTVGEQSINVYTGKNTTKPKPTHELTSNSKDIVGVGVSSNQFGLGGLFIDGVLFTSQNSNQFSSLNYGLESEEDIPEDVSSALFKCDDGCPSEEYSLPPTTKQALLCGSETLCTTDSNGLNIYELEGEELLLRNNLANVSKILIEGDALYALRPDGVLRLDVSSETFSSYYSVVAGQPTCGFTQTSSGYLLCVEGGQPGSNSALMVNTSKKAGVPISLTVNRLRNSEDISSLSVYKNRIFIVPELGELVSDPETGRLRYPESRINQASESINSLINDLGLRDHGYKIKNIYD